MNTEKRQAYIRIGLMSLATILAIIAVFYFKSWWIKVPFILISIILIGFLVRIYLAFKRKKIFFQGKVLTIIPPKKSFKSMHFGKYTIIMKNGKVSKKLFMLTRPNMKVGGMYGVYYEDKSNEIFKAEPLQFQMMRQKKSKMGPQIRM